MKTGNSAPLCQRRVQAMEELRENQREEVRKGNSATVKLVYLLKYEPNGGRTSCENNEGKAALTQSMDCCWITMARKSTAMTILD